MSTCTKWVDRTVIKCKNWAEEIDYKCTSWADEGSSKCSRYADEGSRKCSRYADEGSRKCSKWGKKCKWYTFWNCVIKWFCKAYYWVAKWVCKAWYWVAKWVCKAWYWVAKWVCKAWYWVAKWVCKVFAWVTKVFCTLWSWVMKTICVAWDTARCFALKFGKRLNIIKSNKKIDSLPIEHVFVLMLENRSFDHMMGFSNIKGEDAITGMPKSINGVDSTVNSNINPDTGDEVFVRTPADFSLKDIDKDPGHSFKDTMIQLCGDGAQFPDPVTGGYPDINNTGFIQNYIDAGANSPNRIMDCFSDKQLPILNTLAREFAICDNWFSSMPGPTWPNRFFFMAGTSGGLDDHPSDLDLVKAVTLEGFRFENGNIFDELDDKCIEWLIFEGDEFPVSFALNGMHLNALQGRFKDFDEFEEKINKKRFKKKFIFIEPKYGKHDFAVTGPGDYTCGNSMHPYDDVTRGERLIKKVYETIRNSPRWEKSVLLISFDEHGGFYDHVKPPKAVPPGDLFSTSYNHNNFTFDQLGPRVPTIVVSPLIKKGIIDSTLYDHTSCLASVERLFGLNSLTERDKNANDFLHLFSLVEPRTDTPTRLPNVARTDAKFDCDDEDETVDSLSSLKRELVVAQKEGYFRKQKIHEVVPTDSQIGFAGVALLKVLQKAKYPEREIWKEEFKNIKTSIDAAKFMTNAKLKLRYDADVFDLKLKKRKDIEIKTQFKKKN